MALKPDEENTDLDPAGSDLVRKETKGPETNLKPMILLPPKPKTVAYAAYLNIPPKAFVEDAKRNFNKDGFNEIYEFIVIGNGVTKIMTYDEVIKALGLE